MQLNQPEEHIAREIYGLDREKCIAELRSIHQPRLDFTDDFLKRVSLEHLRHILMAACIQARRHL